MPPGKWGGWWWNCPGWVGSHSKALITLDHHSRVWLWHRTIWHNHWKLKRAPERNDVFKYPIKPRQQYIFPSTLKLTCDFGNHECIWRFTFPVKQANKQKKIYYKKNKQSRIIWTAVSTWEQQRLNICLHLKLIPRDFGEGSTWMTPHRSWWTSQKQVSSLSSWYPPALLCCPGFHNGLQHDICWRTDGR